jgi:hypothetical protein
MSETAFCRRGVLKLGGTAALSATLADRPSSAQGSADRIDETAVSGAAMQRADELLRRMTLEEKAMQLSCVVPLALLDRDGLMRGAGRRVRQMLTHANGMTV